MGVTHPIQNGLSVAWHAVKECVTVTDRAPIPSHNLVDMTALALGLQLTLCHALRVVRVRTLYGIVQWNFLLNLIWQQVLYWWGDHDRLKTNCNVLFLLSFQQFTSKPSWYCSILLKPPIPLNTAQYYSILLKPPIMLNIAQCYSNPQNHALLLNTSYSIIYRFSQA